MTDVCLDLSKVQFPNAASPHQGQDQCQRQAQFGRVVPPNLEVFCRGEVFIPAGTTKAELTAFLEERAP